MSEDQLSEITEYIIRFLLGSKANETFSNLIGYTSDKTLFSKYKIFIVTGKQIGRASCRERV